MIHLLWFDRSYTLSLLQQKPWHTFEKKVFHFRRLKRKGTEPLCSPGIPCPCGAGCSIFPTPDFWIREGTAPTNEKANSLWTHWCLQWPLCYPLTHKQPRNSIRQIKRVFCEATYNEITTREDENISWKRYAILPAFLTSPHTEPQKSLCLGQLWLDKSSGKFYVQGFAEYHRTTVSELLKEGPAL